MSRVTVFSGSNEFDQSSLFAHPDFVNITIRTRSNTSITFDGVNGLYVTITGNFSGDNTNTWTLTGITVGRNNVPGASLTGFFETFTDYANLFGESDHNSFFYSGNDTLTSNSDEGFFYGGHSGDDVFNLSSGDDTVDGGTGTDRLVINDDLFRAEVEQLFFDVAITTNDGRDRLSDIEILEFNDRDVALVNGNDVFSGDILGNQLSQTSNDLIVGTGFADTARGLSGSDFIIGGFGNDTLFGNAGADRLEGGFGDDNLMGGFGFDTLFGNEGADLLLGAHGADVLYGGTGNDALGGGLGNDMVMGEAGNDLVVGGSGADTLLGGTGFDRLRGNAGNDLLQGGHDSDALFGNFGNDVLLGGLGNDFLHGGFGNDSLNGGVNRDRLVGSFGNDTLTGGGAVDTFVFDNASGNDTITDFVVGVDFIQINSGAEDFGDVSIVAVGGDALVSFGNSSVLVEDVSASSLDQSDNFIFI